MRMHDGRYECQQCGEVLDITEDAVPREAMKAASGQLNRRSITLGGGEIHGCAMPSLRSMEETAAPGSREVQV
jgi:hypothetical protein